MKSIVFESEKQKNRVRKALASGYIAGSQRSVPMPMEVFPGVVETVGNRAEAPGKERSEKNVRT